MVWHRLKYLFFLLALLFVSCIRESENFKPIVKLNLTVVDDLNQPVVGARVLAFDDSSTFTNAYLTGDYSQDRLPRIAGNPGSIVTGNNGYVSFIVAPEKEYYILLVYDDIRREFFMSNYGISGLLSKIPKRTTLDITAIIGPQNGNVIFYSTSNNQTPIQVNVGSTGNAILGSITGIYTSPDTPGVASPNIFKARRQPGRSRYFAKSDQGCVWDGEIVIEKGKNTYVNLDNCLTGRVAFHAQESSGSVYPISITLGGFNLPGESPQLLSVRDALTCDQLSSISPSNASVAQFQRSIGTYSYYAQSADGQCVWTGNLVVAEEDCKIVTLGPCNF